MGSLSPEELHALRNELLAMDLAAALSFDRLFGKASRGNSSRNTKLARNAIAQAIALLLPVYFISEDGADVAPMPGNAMLGGLFVDGGRRITYRDGRPDVTRLAIKTAQLSAAIAALAALKQLLEDLIVHTA